ncbi:MAG: class I SAM-dependent methyltransferase [Gammaproteobacteria bacterium]|nr:class I SAM-dependent methyltransferase [Gammaproteobacteria bacterium]MDH3749233.1 class I SAM-dependent methyltransferase [Gammaproteobacteria bacterium]MDH3803885.1 class I SAM-dependent methyltransferase [Gammaproteobacteria bacterium]
MVNTGAAARQKAIVDWFNAAYAQKGDRYLRPTRAYTIYLELLQAQPGQRLLDVACGLGRLLEAARPYGVKMFGIDISNVAVAAARQNVAEATIEHGNAEQLPYADASFDLVTCIGSLERVLNTETALAEMRRVGNANARFCILVRNSQTFSWKLKSMPPFARNKGNAGANTLEGWTQLLESNGFAVQSVLPDQYPLHVRAQWKSLFLRPVDFNRPIAARLDRANEFLFLLEKDR